MSGTTDLIAVVRTAGLDATGVADTSAPATDVEYRFDPQSTVTMLAEAIRGLHDLEIPSAASQLPRLSMADVLALAEATVAADELRDLDPAYTHLAPPRLLEILREGAAKLGELDPAREVITHGGVGLAALRCVDGEAVGFAQWDAAAIADRHRDLAAAATEVAAAFGPMIVPHFFESYGSEPDPLRLDWWALARQLTNSANRAPGTSDETSTPGSRGADRSLG